jgi:hypothetical protein
MPRHLRSAGSACSLLWTEVCLLHPRGFHFIRNAIRELLEILLEQPGQMLRLFIVGLRVFAQAFFRACDLRRVTGNEVLHRLFCNPAGSLCHSMRNESGAAFVAFALP